MSAILPILILRVRILNEENGGITTISDFEDEDPNDNRQRPRFILLMRNHF
jgi:hypothetical protein